MQPGILFIALIAALQIQYGARLSDAAISGYLDFDNLPETNFSCEGKVIGGYYADVETGCQMFHVCTIGQKGEVTDIKFLCLNGTVFDQETRVCERIDEVDCSQAEEFYGLNLELYGANAYIAGVSGSIIQEDLDDAANSEEVETSTIPSTTPSSTTTTTTVAATTAATTTTTTTTTTPPPPPPPPPRPSTPSPSPPPKFVPPTPRPSPHPHHQYGPTSPGTLSLLAFAQNQNHEGLPDVVPHQHQQIFHNSQRPQLRPSQPTRPPVLSTTRRPALNLNLKHQLTSNRPPLQQSIHPSHFPVTARPTQIGQSQPHRHQQQPQPTLQSFKQYQQEQKAQQELQRQKEEQQKQQEQFSTQHHYFGSGYHKHNFQHHTQLPQSSPSSILSPSPSPSPSHLLSPPPAPSPSPSQAPYHHTQPFHPLILNGLALEQGQQASPSPSPTPSAPHQSFYSGHHFSTSVPSLREGKSIEQDDDPEAAHEAHTQHQQQLQQQHQQQIQQQHQQQIHQQQQHQIQQQQQQQIQQQKIEERQQQQIKQHQQQQQKQQQHFPPPPTVAVVSSSSSTSTSHSSVAIVTGGFNHGGTSSTTTPNPPPVTSTSISISGPSGGGHTIIDHGLPVEASGPSAEGSTEVYDEEYSDSDYSLDSFFDDVPKLRSDGRGNRRRRRDVEEERNSAGTRDGVDARRRGRGRSRYSSVPLQVSNAFVAVEPEKEQPPAVEREEFRPRATPSDRVRNAAQQAKPGERIRVSQVRASFRAQPIAEEPQRGRGSLDSRRRTHSRSRQPLPAANEKDDASVSVEPTTVPPTTTVLPETSFTCDDKVPGGLYADPETDCQLFHICSQGRHGKFVDNKFLCGPETRFNQQSRTCQAKEMVDCASSPSYYFLNKHFQHHLLADVKVHPELQFEPLKVRKKRSPLSTDAGKLDIKQQKTLQGGSSVDTAKQNSIRLQHCFDEKHCGNKWQILINVRNTGEVREKRDLANSSFDRRRSRFSLSGRRTTTERPKESTPLVLRFPNRSFLKPTFAPSRKVVSTTRAPLEKTTAAPRSFVPSRSKFKRPPIVEQTTTEAPKRRPLFTRPTPNPVFSRRGPTTVKSEENHDSVEINQKRDSKLPVTFRRHQILAQSKVPKLVDEVKVEAKDVTTKDSVEVVKEVTEKPTNSEKKDEGDVQYDDEDYTDEEEEVSEENNVESGQHPADTQGGKKTDATFQSNAQKSEMKPENKISIISPVLGIQVDGKKDDNQNKAIFDDDEEAYSDEYYDEEPEAENDDTDNPLKKFLLENQKSLKSTSIILPGNFKISNGRIYAVKNDDVSESNVEDSFEEESYEDDWESEELDDTNSEKQDDAEGVLSNSRNTMSNRKYFGRHTDGDVTENSPHRTTLAAKHDSEFGLSEGEEDDFEETNRAVRKTSIGRRRNQALDNEGKKIKVVYVKASPEKSQEENPIESSRDKDDVIDEDEKLKENEEAEEDDQDVGQIERGTSKNRNDQRSFVGSRQRISSSSVNAVNKPKTIVITKKIIVPVNADEDGPLPEDDEDYAEYDDSTSSKKSFPLENRKISNKEIVLDQGSLLHLPIPLLRNGNDDTKQGARRNGASWEDGEESYPFEQEDDEYTIEDNEGFQEDDEEYDDQEEGHIHDDKKAKVSDDEESYPDEEEEPMIVRGRIKFKNNEAKVLQTNQDEEEYYDEEEEETVGQDNSKGINIKDDEYDVMVEDDNNGKWHVISPSTQRKDKDTKSAPLPYLRLVSPEEELTTRPSSTPNLFRTSKPRQRSWKQASAPEPPPVILPRRTTPPPEIETEPPSRANSRFRERQGSRRVVTPVEKVESQDKQTPRRWQPRQRGGKELTQREETSTAKTFTPSRGRFTVNNDREESRGGRGRQNFSAKRFRAPAVFTTTPAYPVRTTEKIIPSTKSNRISRPRLRSHIRKKISDEVQFSESQLSKSTHNLPLPFQEDDEDLEKYWPGDRGHKRTDKRKYISFNELPNSGRVESNTEPTLPTEIDFTSVTPASRALSRDTYFPLHSTTSTPPTPGAFSCIGLEMYIYHADPLNSQLFHYCSPGFSRGQILDFRFSCVKGMSFSEEKQSCVNK